MFVEPTCRHCATGGVSRPQGLCWSCYYTPGVRTPVTPVTAGRRRGVFVSDFDALLRGVLLNPAADLPRLILADYLEEAGDEESVLRGRFVRDQCELLTARWKKDKKVHAKGVSTYLRGSVASRSRPWVADVLDRHRLGFSADGWGYTVVPCDNGDCRISRGFVSSVRTTLEKFFGTPCPSCAGCGPWSRPFDRRVYQNHCRACFGPDTANFAAGLFAEHPVTAVGFYGYAPAASVGGGFWCLPGLSDAGVPQAFSRLAGLRFETERHALAALSAHAVNHGRGLVGLPPLPPAPGGEDL